MTKAIVSCIPYSHHFSITDLNYRLFYPIVLKGYKKDKFARLLKVVYPRYVHTMFMFHLSLSYLWTFDRATSPISGEKLELHLKKEEWVSVLKLSTIWNMTKVL